MSKNREREMLVDRAQAVMLGVAIGDALGLPVETLTADEIAKRVGRITDYVPCTHNKFLKDGYDKGTVSDDTQLSLAIAQSLVESRSINLESIARHHVKAFEETTLGWGGSTKESVRRIQQGTHWSEASSTDKPHRGTGNGVAMKVAPLGVFLALSGESLDSHLNEIANVALMTHRTSMAISSAFAHVAAVMYCLRNNPDTFDPQAFTEYVVRYSEQGRKYLPETRGDDDLTDQLKLIDRVSMQSSKEIENKFGGGSCYVFHSLPFSYAYFLKHRGRVEALIDVVNAGGDTDSNGSIVGALIGALGGESSFPRHLVRGLPQSESYREAGAALT